MNLMYQTTLCPPTGTDGNLLCSMQNNAENIRQIEYVLVMMEHVRKQRRRHRIVSRTEVKEFFMYAFRVYDRIQHRMHIQHLNYTYVCYVICSRYLFESCLHIPNRRFVSPATVNSYFKKERGRRYSTCEYRIF